MSDTVSASRLVSTKPDQAQAQAVPAEEAPATAATAGPPRPPPAVDASRGARLVVDEGERADAAAEERGSGQYRVPWAELLKKVFAVDVLECPECHGRLKVIAYVTEAKVVAKVLGHLGLDATGPPVAKVAPAEEGCDPPPDYDQVDPTYEE